MTLILHGIADFASLIPRLVMAEAGIDFRYHAHDMEAGTLIDPAYRRINPFGLIPSLETADGPIFETGAILLWLADRHPGLAPAINDADRGQFLSWLMWTANTLHPLMMDLLHPYRPAGEEHAAAVSAIALIRVTDRLPQLERLAISAPDWFCPDQPGILVPYVAVLLRWMRAFAPIAADRLDMGQFPVLEQLLATYEKRPAVQSVAAAEGLGPTPFTHPVP
jgi:glutathione S-transferase